MAQAMVTTPVKASHAQGQCAKIRRIGVEGGTDLCSMSNEREITSNVGFFRAGSACGVGKGLASVKSRLELGNLK